ncbi:MAG: thermopsin family protease [Thermoplasmata archaeon]
MRLRRWAPAWAVVGALVITISSLGLANSLQFAGRVSPPEASGAGLAGLTGPPPPVRSAQPGAALPDSGVSHGNHAPSPNTAAQALEAAHADGISSRFVFVPGPGETAAQVGAATATGHISLPYQNQAITAPMGIGDFGLRTALNGSVEPYVLNTTSLRATLDTNTTGGIQPLYVLDSSPDAYSAELGGVLTNVTLLGNHSYQFWAQNVVTYYAQSHLLYLVSNLWNFSGPVFTPNAIVAHGPNNASLVNSEVYLSHMELTNVTYPFNLTLFLNSTVASGNDSVNFTAVLSTDRGTTSHPFDYLVFNSTAPGTPGVTAPAGFSANGFTIDPTGHTNDFEFVLGGPGGGSQVNLFEAQATMTLDYWNGSTDSYEAVPSALSYGGDSGESSSGANIEWEEGATGPYAIVSGGPSILTGLWNASGTPGVATIQTMVQPTDAFVFVQPVAAPFTVSEPEWAPTLMESSISIAPGTYTVTAMMSYFASFNETFSNLVPGPSAMFSVNLLQDNVAGVTTPIWVWNDGQFPAISSGGLGTKASPYMIKDQQNTSMASVFGVLNDYLFPEFSGVFFVGTNRSAELYEPGPFETNIPYVAGLPATNELSYTFYHVSNVSVVDATNISGWFSSKLFVGSPTLPGYPFLATANMVFWNSPFNLVAHDTFDTQSEGIYLYGGSHNTIWNNTIQWDPRPSLPADQLWPQQYALGIEEGESGDLIFNNAIYTQITAMTPLHDAYTGRNASYSDVWNINKTTLSSTQYAAGFPNIPLYGSIVNTTYQGGNFWWDYGWPDNPLLPLPYNESGMINQGQSHQSYVEGDYVPLVPSLSLTFYAQGYTASTSWSVTLTTEPSGPPVTQSSTTNSLEFVGLNDSPYTWAVSPPAGWAVTPPSGNLAFVRSTVVNVTFALSIGWLAGTVKPPSAIIGLVVMGLPVNVTVNVTTGAFNQSLPPGVYSVTASAPQFQTNESNVSVSSTRTTLLTISLVPYNGTVEGNVIPTDAYVAIGGNQVFPNGAGGFIESLLPGSYAVTGSLSGYVTTTVQVIVTSNHTTFVNLTLAPNSPRFSYLSAFDWELIGFATAGVIVVLIVGLILIQRGKHPPAPSQTSASPAPAKEPEEPDSPGTGGS